MTDDVSELHRLCDVAAEAARLAGSIMRSSFEGDFSFHEKSSFKELVSDVDLQCQETVVGHVLEAFPDHAILGEESDEHLDWRSCDGTVWLIDPIDGTTNYVNGIPFCCVSVAAARDSKVVAGAILDPFRDELFTAVRSDGAQLNGKSISVSKCKNLADSVVATEIHYALLRGRTGHFSGFPRVGRSVRSVRVMGSAALALAYVARGRLDAYWTANLSPWDTAVGQLLIEEAGGRVTDLAGNAYYPRNGPVLASNGRIHNKLLAIVH
ncbi:MAG: inositol monophosphatase family protein [Candidatus Undinarchaeales archaeon]|jgi:myo-inositol-1(or 4)-monophosphatase|nr:inositol monophosphatase family protein [Candidatus Undinarchaeales archaeon]MDP7494675.1 inositol monophosphatase family protein [Candidatus Undinarchaeales archaeon]